MIKFDITFSLNSRVALKFYFDKVSTNEVAYISVHYPFMLSSSKDEWITFRVPHNYYYRTIRNKLLYVKSKYPSLATENTEFTEKRESGPRSGRP